MGEAIKKYQFCELAHPPQKIQKSTELAARALISLGSLVEGVNIILRVVILFFHEPFYGTNNNKIEKRSKILLVKYFFVFHFMFIALALIAKCNFSNVFWRVN